MEDLESLSNNELRQRLLECGFPNTPITDTTRKILIKRLRNHLSKNKTHMKKQILSLTRFSSDEESDIEQQNRNNVPDSYKRKTYSSYQTNNYTVPNSFKSFQNSSLLNSRLSNSNATSLSKNNYSLNNNNCNISSDKYKISPTSRIYVSPTISYQDRSPPSSGTGGLKFQNYNETYDLSDYSDIEYNNGSPVYKTTTNNFNTQRNPDESLSYRSNFTRRLLNLRNETLASNKPIAVAQPKSQPFNEQNNSSSVYPFNNVPLNNTGLNKRSYYNRRSNYGENDRNNLSPSAAFKNVIKNINEHYGVQQHFIPCMLVSVAIIFFIFLSFLYINITPNLISTVTENNAKLNFCKLSSDFQENRLLAGNHPESFDPESCIYKHQINDALDIIKILLPILQQKAEEHFCKDRSKDFSLNSRNAINLIYERLNTKGLTPDIRKITHDLHNAELLIESNPQWHISNVNKAGEKISYDEVLNLRNSKENYFAILKPSLPLFCSIYNKLERFFFLIGSLFLSTVIVGVFYGIMKLIKNYKQYKQKAIFNMVEEIINNLISKAERTPTEKSVVVNHLRDMIIPVHKRKEMDWAWNKAISYLEQNESRVVFEMGVINGEDCQMVKWIDTVSPDQSSISSENRKINISKKWESPAFIDKTNKILNPPTPCLKIRQMFDKSEANDPNLTQVIHDAILEKVGSNCKIYDIQIDKQTCCVYVRCASEQDAGMVHDEINGWWFDKRLVSIKFLRLERYLARFPNSLAGPKCLHPSNTKKLSMSQCLSNLRDYDDDDDSDDEQS